MDRFTEFTFGIPWIMSFFHQDWTLDAATEREAVVNQFVEELEPEAVLLVRRDTRLLLDGLPSERITLLWERGAEGGEYFFRRGRVTDGAEWMREVIGVCDASVGRTPRRSPARTGTRGESWPMRSCQPWRSSGVSSTGRWRMH
jgi:hypothetical protein